MCPREFQEGFAGAYFACLVDSIYAAVAGDLLIRSPLSNIFLVR
jgi:hypothetical protein